jgi:hypothetical protein
VGLPHNRLSFSAGVSSSVILSERSASKDLFKRRQKEDPSSLRFSE